VSSGRTLLLALAAAFAASRPCAATEDTQLWAEVGVEAPLGGGFRASVGHESRFTDDVHRYGLHGYDAGVSWAASKRLTLALHFLEEFQRSGDRFFAESRPFADALFRHPLGAFEIALRTRVEARLLRDVRDRARVRERVQVVLPWALWRDGPRPFLSEEVLFESDGRGFDQNRLTLGLSGRRAALSASLYGMLLSNERDDWEHTAVFGVALTWSFAGAPTMTGGR
jgi:hypothetical protein